MIDAVDILNDVINKLREENKKLTALLEDIADDNCILKYERVELVDENKLLKSVTNLCCNKTQKDNDKLTEENERLRDEVRLYGLQHDDVLDNLTAKLATALETIARLNTAMRDELEDK